MFVKGREVRKGEKEERNERGGGKTRRKDGERGWVREETEERRGHGHEEREEQMIY